MSMPPRQPQLAMMARQVSEDRVIIHMSPAGPQFGVRAPRPHGSQPRHSLIVRADSPTSDVRLYWPSRRLALERLQTSRGPLDSGWGVRVEHELDMADAGFSVAGQVCGKLFRL